MHVFSFMVSRMAKRKVLEILATLLLLLAVGSCGVMYLWYDWVNQRLRLSLGHWDHTGTINRYVSMGASVHVQNQQGVTPLIVVAFQGDLPLMRLLLDRGADVNHATRIRLTPLLAGIHGRTPTETSRLLLAHGADVNAADHHGQTALMAACDKGDTACVQLLLHSGAQVNARGDDGRTALSHAADAGQGQIVRLLKRAGATR